MKTIKTLFIALLMISTVSVSAQTVDEIIDNYFENTGGLEAWNNLESAKFIGSASGQGMDIPVVMIQTKDGKQHLTVTFQGQEFVQFAFDGETMWSTNFMTMLPEKNDNETTDIMKKQAKDFPSPFLNYKEKGFTVELLGNETMEGIDTYKVQLTQEPILVDGKEEPNVKLIEKLIEFRARYLRMPYGDQAIFVRRSVFEKLGGFARVPLAEDLLFM